jgi:hypothetical protein
VLESPTILRGLPGRFKIRVVRIVHRWRQGVRIAAESIPSGARLWPSQVQSVNLPAAGRCPCGLGELWLCPFRIPRTNMSHRALLCISRRFNANEHVASRISVVKTQVRTIAHVGSRMPCGAACCDFVRVPTFAHFRAEGMARSAWQRARAPLRRLRVAASPRTVVEPTNNRIRIALRGRRGAVN